MLNISRQIYAGTGTTSKYALLEAEIIPYGETTNEKKKLEKHTQKFTNLHEYENTPLPGFTLYKSDRKNFGSIEQTWLVIDPRGFLVRISSSNLESILQVTGITEGLIQERCVWARDDSQTKMSLVPISSPMYIEAVKNTEMIEGKVNLKDVQIGDTVLLQNGLTGIYRGVLSLYGTMDTNHKSLNFVTRTYLRRQVVEVGPDRYYYHTDAKILKITNRTTTPMTRVESAIEINKSICAGQTYFCGDPSIGLRTHTYYGSIGLIKQVSVHAVIKPSITLEEITKEDAADMVPLSAKSGDASMLALQDGAGKYFLLDFPYLHTTLTQAVSAFNVTEVLYSTGIVNSLSRKTLKKFFGHSTTGALKTVDDYKKFYKIVKHVKTDSYN